VSRPSAFRTPEARDEYVRHYDAAVGQATIPVEEADVDTTWGRTHVISAGDPGAPPLVALHAKSCSATMWVPHLPTLAARHRVHLVDAVGDLGKSVATGVLTKPALVAAWIDEVLDRLRIERTAVVAASIGTWMAVHHAAEHPERVERMALLCPAGIVRSMPPGVMVRLVRYAARPRPGPIAEMLDWMVMPPTRPRLREDPWRPVAQQFVTGMCGFRANLREPKPATCKGLDRVAAARIPTLVVIGRQEVLHDAEDLATRFRQALPHARVELLDDANHLLFIDQQQAVAALLDDFLT
jgi:pimeloyl-ACP methyl ester carboxylesterase